MDEEDRTGVQVTHRDAFVVRIWRERDKPGWQGWVQHADTGESTAVRTTDDLLAFIEKRAGKLREAARKGIK